jgi:rhodanese-related sulfurtransferase
MNTISRDELARKLGSPRLVVVNVLAAPAYDEIHIKGSISIPRAELERGGWKEIDFTKEIVVHCSSFDCEASREAARFLETKGFQVSAYEGGMAEWAEARLPTEGTLTPEAYLKERRRRQRSVAPSPA